MPLTLSVKWNRLKSLQITGHFLMKLTSDYLVVGSGIAGLCYALSVADRGQVALITKREIATTATRLAQGGIAAVATSNDSFEQQIGRAHV